MWQLQLTREPRLHKNSASKEITCTAFKFTTKPAGSGSHGWAVAKSDDWYYTLRDKDEKKLTPGNLVPLLHWQWDFFK